MARASKARFARVEILERAFAAEEKSSITKASYTRCEPEVSASPAPSRAFAPTARYVFRALRHGGEGLMLRRPDARLRSAFSQAQVREALVLAIAKGNSSTFTSPFVHASTNVDCCRALMKLRGMMYSGQMVRIDISGFQPEHVIDLSTYAGQQRWLREEDGDSDAFHDMLSAARAFSRKDKEVLLLASPPDGAVVPCDHYSGEPLGTTPQQQQAAAFAAPVKVASPVSRSRVVSSHPYTPHLRAFLDSCRPAVAT